ncbi:ECF transporter S component [Corticicoccus populi]|uniref:ECF transporter S component n=1 Tax=Corticicoccus populi TaxID=1812821 RepID=A0ABW5WWB5_9STAP
MKRGLKYDFSLLALLLIPVGVSLNVVGYQLSTILKLPLIIDQIGTILVSLIAGPWVGLITGLLANVVNGMINPIAIPYGLVSMSIGLAAGFFSRWGLFRNIFGIILSVIVLTVLSASTAAVVTVLLFGGVTGAGTDLVTAAFLAAGQELWRSVISTNLITGTANTVINVAVGLLIVHRIPDRFLIKLNYGGQFIKKGAIKS